VTSYAIVVNVSGGSARRSDKKIEPDRVAKGEYDITFPEDVSSWLWQASLGAADDDPQIAGYISTELGDMSSENIVKVRTFDYLGVPDNRPFHLLVSDI
jgi:hypothetical protein